MQSNENAITHYGETGIKNDDYIMMPEEHRRIKKEMSVPSRMKGDGATAADPDINQRDEVKNNSRTEEAGAGKSSVSGNSGTSTGNTEGRSKNPHSVVEYDKSGNFPEDSSTSVAADFKHRNSDTYELQSNVTTKSATSSNLSEKARVAQTDALPHSSVSGASSIKSRTDKEDNTADSRGQHYGTDSLSDEELSSRSETGDTESMSEVGKRQIIQHNFTENVADTVWRNRVLNKNGGTAVAEALRPHIDDDNRFHTAGNTKADSGFSMSRDDQNNSEGSDGDRSTTYALSDSLLLQEEGPHTSFDSFHSGMAPRQVTGGHAPSYYAHGPPATGHLGPGWNDMSQLCAVPCSPMNYHMHPYAYGAYGPVPAQSYATVGHVTHAQLPPVQFPEIHGTSSAVHGIQVGSAKAYGGLQSYGSAGHAYVQEPMNHLEYSFDTPQKYLHTSILMKAPQPLVDVPAYYIHPHLYHAENNIDLHKSTYLQAK